MSVRRLRSWIRRLFWLAFALTVYVLYVYVALPALLQHYEHRPALRQIPKSTTISHGGRGHPINVGVVGEPAELVNAFVTAGWDEAASNATDSRLFGRHPDLAFERRISAEGDERHHVRFWKLDQPSGVGRPTWVGTATHSLKAADKTEDSTRRLAADIDYSRDRLIADLSRAEQVVLIYQVTGSGAKLFGRTGSGDRYYTDGELSVAVLAAGNVRQTTTPDSLPNPRPVVIKGHIWSAARRLLGAANANRP